MGPGVQTHGRMHGRARALTPQITSGMEKAATDWPAEPSLSLGGQGNFARLFPPPPHLQFHLMVKQQQSFESLAICAGSLLLE